MSKPETAQQRTNKMETRMHYEQALQDYKEPILYFREVFIWKRPIDFGVFSVLILYLVWAIGSLELPYLSLFFCFYAIFSILRWILSSVGSLPWGKLANVDDKDAFEHFIELAVGFRFFVTQSRQTLLRFREHSPTQFTIQIVLVSVVLAWFFSCISGFWTIMLAVVCLLLTPGLIHNKVPQQVEALIEPHLATVKPILKEKLGPILAKVYPAAFGDAPAPKPEKAKDIKEKDIAEVVEKPKEIEEETPREEEQDESSSSHSDEQGDETKME